MSAHASTMLAPKGLAELCDGLPGIAIHRTLLSADGAVRLLFVSRGIVSLIGMTPEELAANPTRFGDGILPDDRPALLRAIRRAAASRQPLQHTFRQRQRSGDLRRLHIRGTATFFDELTILVDGILEDAGCEARPAMASDSEEIPRLFMHHSAAVLWIKDASGRYVFLSGSAAAIFGNDPSSWVGKTDADLWPAEVAAQLRAADLLALESNQPVEKIGVTINATGGETHWRTVKFPFTDDLGQRYVGGVGLDVTECERARAELRRTNEDLRAAVERVRRLESVVRMCAWTRRFEIDGRWVSVEDFLWERLGVRVSHGISDDGLSILSEELARIRREPPG